MRRSGKPRQAHKRAVASPPGTGSPAAAGFVVRGDHITLGQFLKAVGAIGAGGEARGYLDSGAVRVNGQPEERRGRKLRAGDLVRIEGEGEWRIEGESGPPLTPPTGREDSGGSARP